MSDEKTLEQVQAAQADPGSQPGGKAADPAAGADAGAKGKDGDGKGKGNAGDENFRSLRKEIRAVQRQVAEKDQTISTLQARTEALLDAIEKMPKARQPEADPLAHLPADDPDRPLIERKIKPLIDRISKGDPEVGELKKEIEALRNERKAEADGRAKVAEFDQTIAEIAEDRGLSAEVTAAVRETIVKNRVGGRTYEEAFDNALVYLKGSGEHPGNGKKKDAGDDPASVGGVMPRQAGAPVPSEDFRTLRKTWHEARGGDDAQGEARAFHNLLLKVQAEQGRAG